MLETLLCKWMNLFLEIFYDLFHRSGIEAAVNDLAMLDRHCDVCMVPVIKEHTQVLMLCFVCVLEKKHVLTVDLARTK